jgi:hypothetical protein
MPAPAERQVTTLIGDDGPGVQFARSSAESFKRAVRPLPWALAVHTPPVRSPPSGAAVATDADAERDVGSLYVGCRDGVHAFDLAEGKRTHFPIVQTITGLAVTEDGARLFVVAPQTVSVLDLRDDGRLLLCDGLCDRRSDAIADHRTVGIGSLDCGACACDRLHCLLLACRLSPVRLSPVRIPCRWKLPPGNATDGPPLLCCLMG